jgi:hypothetical protein
MHRVAAEFVPQLLTDEQDFLTKMATTVIPQSPYLPDLAPADFSLFQAEIHHERTKI